MIDSADIEFAQRLAETAAKVSLSYFRTAVQVDDKDDASPVTIADRTAEKVMRELIAKERPNDGILGEEFGRERMDARRVWVLDPIDGTKAFISGNPLFGTLIGLAIDGKPAMGVIDCPALGERWIGAKGQATRFTDAKGTREVKTRACPDLKLASLYSAVPVSSDANFPAFDRLRGQVKRPLPVCDCYAYGLLARGGVDLVVEAGLGIYDFTALVPVVEGAGGTIHDWQGKALTTDSPGFVIAAGDARMAAAAVAALRA